MQLIHPKEPARVPLANLPTPVVPLRHLAADLKVPQILMKRDDLTGLELTGNKVRKLEYLLAEAIQTGCDTIVTHGGYQSNHCRATAAACAHLGLRLRLILRSAGAGTPPRVGNLLLDHLFGAHVSFHAPEEYNANRQALIDGALAAERNAGRRPYFFPVGGSVPLGTWGYVRCVHELLAQTPGGQEIDLYTAVSSSGTYAGLLIGKALLKADRLRVVGVPVSDKLELFRPDVLQQIRDAAALYELPIDADAIKTELLDGFIGPGYAIPTDLGNDAVRLVARREGITLDPTYTGKAMAGFLHSVRDGLIRDGATPMFLHTGGIFGMLARPELFADG